MRKLLGRVAVPIETAHELWSWGSVADVTRLRAVSSESEEPTNWSQLMAFRSAKPGTEWTQKQKGLAAQEAKRRKNSPGAKGIAKAMARELDITVTRLNGLIRSANEDNKRVAARGKAA